MPGQLCRCVQLHVEWSGCFPPWFPRFLGPGGLVPCPSWRNAFQHGASSHSYLTSKFTFLAPLIFPSFLMPYLQLVHESPLPGNFSITHSGHFLMLSSSNYAWYFNHIIFSNYPTNYFVWAFKSSATLYCMPSVHFFPVKMVSSICKGRFCSWSPPLPSLPRSMTCSKNS